MTDDEKLGLEQTIADLRFELKQALDQRDLLAVKVSQWEAVALTDEERGAVQWAIDAANGMAQAEPWAVAALRSLLKRLA